MKISTIIKKKNLTSVTIHNHGNYTVVELFLKGSFKPTLNVYRSFNLDVNIPEISNNNVKHLGIKKHYYLVNEKFYVNYYIY